MSVSIIDVPSLIALGAVTGYLDAKKWRRDHPDLYAGVSSAVLAAFWLKALLRAAGTGKPLGGNRTNKWIALFMVLSYPLWFGWGAERARSLFGRTPEQGGMLWPFTLRDGTEPFKPAWHAGGDKDPAGE